MDELGQRAGLPEALKVLLREYPRDIWQSHRNFDGLTRFWLQRHMMFRDGVSRLQAEAEGFLDRRLDARAYAQQTARLASFVLNELHGHHHIEDVHYFPLLSGLEPRLAAGFELLDRDHHALDGHLHGLAAKAQAVLDAVVAGEGAEAAAGGLHGELKGFERFLDRHLIDEEELVVPVILHHAPRM